MNMLNIIFIRSTQAAIGIFFVFVISAFFGLLLLTPLAVLYHLTNFFTSLGANGIFAFIVSAPLSAAIFYRGYKIEGLYNAIAQTGIQLIHIAKQQLLAIDSIATKDVDIIEQNKADAGSST